MRAQAVITLGYRVVILDPVVNGLAKQVADEHIIARNDDQQAIKQLRNVCAYVTYELENIPKSSLKYLEAESVLPQGYKRFEIS